MVANPLQTDDRKKKVKVDCAILATTERRKERLLIENVRHLIFIGTNVFYYILNLKL
jgi:hypothetical protein